MRSSCWLCPSLCLALCVAGIATAEPVSPPLRVAAASDLALVLNELGAVWERKTGQKIMVTIGATGMLSRQLVEGAPFDAFLAADVDSVDAPARSGQCAADSRRIYARGRLAVWTRLPPPPTTLEALADPQFRRIAIANPAHAPYGRAAEAALRKAGVWDKISTRIVHADNVQRALELARTGNVDVALVAASLVQRAGGGLFLVDDKLHPPIEQAAIACGREARLVAARAFVEFLGSGEAQTTLGTYGFEPPTGGRVRKP